MINIEKHKKKMFKIRKLSEKFQNDPFFTTTPNDPYYF